MPKNNTHTASTQIIAENKKETSTKLQQIEIPKVELPEGGGAVKGINANFTQNPVKGSFSFEIPIPYSHTRGVKPGVAISYNSQSGNSVIALGWQLSIPCISRKTNSQIPTYDDENMRDEFILEGYDDLIVAYKQDNTGKYIKNLDGKFEIDVRTSSDNLYKITKYKPRVEGLFALIEKYERKSDGDIHWVTTSGDNTKSIYGKDTSARLVNCNDKSEVYKWLIELTYDDKGNAIKYLYKQENDQNIDLEKLSNHERMQDGKLQYSNVYISKILYTNIDSFSGSTSLNESDFYFETIFDYGEYDVKFHETSQWEERYDSFSSCTSGFEVRTTRQLKRIFTIHRFEDMVDGSSVTSCIKFNYDNSSVHSLLTSTESIGYRKKEDGSYSFLSLPPTVFNYTEDKINSEFGIVENLTNPNIPSGIMNGYTFVDLYNEGINGILYENQGALYYLQNMGNAKFTNPKELKNIPNLRGLNDKFSLQDIDANTVKSFMSISPDSVISYGVDSVDNPKVFSSNINFKVSTSDVTNLDLNGDGKADLLKINSNELAFWINEGSMGYKSQEKIFLNRSLEVDLEHYKNNMFLADINGDGLTDIVFVFNDKILYYLNFGYGKFSTKYSLSIDPITANDSFSVSNVKFSDINGDGCDDMLYLHSDKISLYRNYSGNDLVCEIIENTPNFSNFHQCDIVDLFGKGTKCIVYSSILDKDSSVNFYYLNLYPIKKPYLLASYENSMGSKISIEYKSSVEYYLEDKYVNSQEWLTKLPFASILVDKVVKQDLITNHVYESSYKYHHGYFDSNEREYRGFGRVDTLQSEKFENFVKTGASNVTLAEMHQPPILTKTWYHLGFDLEKDLYYQKIKKEFWVNQYNIFTGSLPIFKEKNTSVANLEISEDLSETKISELKPEIWEEGYRACSSLGIRTEVFSVDAETDEVMEKTKELIPLRVSEVSFKIELLQLGNEEMKSCIIVKECENIEYIYDRSLNNPRVVQKFNLKLDKYGNPIEGVVIAYPRFEIDTELPQKVQQEQAKYHINYIRNSYTNDINSSEVYRLRLPVDSSSYEVKNLFPTSDYFEIEEFANLFEESVFLEFHENSLNPPVIAKALRLVSSKRNIYYDNDLHDPLPLGQLGNLGILYESYLMSYDKKLIENLYGSKVNNADLINNHFVNLGGDAWWIPSGRTIYSTPLESASDIKARFTMPISYISSTGAETKIKYYQDKYLLIEEVEDALNNISKVLEFDLYTLAPRVIKDCNDNITEVYNDELGAIRCLAIKGKNSTGDNLDNFSVFTDDELKTKQTNLLSSANTNILDNAKDLLSEATIYYFRDLFAFKNTGKPVSSWVISRETHVNQVINSEVQVKVDYHSGLGEIIASKVQAEGGIAKEVSVDIAGNITISELDTGSLPRWIGNGRSVKNNRGNIVKQYEPYISTKFSYETELELIESGCFVVNHYDPLYRIVRTDYPNGTFAKVEFSSYHTVIYDQNDNLLGSTWYINRKNNLIDSELLAVGRDPVLEKNAAINTESHANTPQITHTDSLGRVIYQVDDLGLEAGIPQKCETFLELDFEGNTKSITDPRGNILVKYSYNMIGVICSEESLDRGKRWVFNDVEDKNIYNFDSKGRKIIFTYDILSRLVEKKVVSATELLDNIFHKVVYGESLIDSKTRNIRKKIHQIWDTAGLLQIDKYTEKYDAEEQYRQILINYKSVVNYSIPNPIELLSDEKYSTKAKFDAFSRLVEQTSADGSLAKYKYNLGRLMCNVDVTIDGISKKYIKNISYNLKGQREKIIYGNDVTIEYKYDNETFRLLRQQTKRKNSSIIQDLNFTYDPVGNVISIKDNCVPTTFFNNFGVSNISRYTYDPMYRLKTAEGREHIAQTTATIGDSWNDFGKRLSVSPSDPLAFRNYVEEYNYDKMGNMISQLHSAFDNDWARENTYDTNSNRIISSRITSPNFATIDYNYTLDANHGFMASMPHLSNLDWNFLERIASVSSQIVNDGTPETTYYIYDSDGKRVKKITENASINGTSSKKSERIYIGVVEIYKEFESNDDKLIRNTYKVKDAHGVVAIVENRSFGEDEFEQSLTRYQYANLINSVSLETDDTQNANVITYEEYYPFGSTSYSAQNKSIKSVAKRYGYTAKERDEESGFIYHGKRYYIPWLCRWISTDPIGISDGLNSYVYVSNNPIRFTDPTGMGAWDRFCGGLKMVGGALETVAGAGLFVAGVGTSELGVGVPVAIAGGAVTLHGADTTISGWRTLWNGEQVDTLTSSVILQDGLGMERSHANLADGAISIVGTLGANVATRAPALVTTVAADGTAAAPAVETSISIAFKPAGAVGHNMVGVTTETGTTWTHLVIAESGATTGGSGVSVMTSGRAAVIVAESGPSSAYTVVTMPVTAAEATAANTYALTTVARDAPIILAIEEGTAATSALRPYTLLGNSCSTYAAEVMQAGGVVTPPVTAPILNLGVGALQSSRVMQPLTTVALGVESSYLVTQSGPLLIGTAEAAEPPSPIYSSSPLMSVSPPLMSVAPAATVSPRIVIVVQAPPPPPLVSVAPVSEVCESSPISSEPDYSSMVCEQPDYSQMVCQ